ncbi:MAG TPA: hypothetical protein VNG53_00260 [Bacteroidia bacterium]|nr:hypothetical protein [Bacteroidia bacterium]
MAKKKNSKSKSNKVSEPTANYQSKKITFFNSFEEQAAYELKQMAALSSIQILQQLRKFINIAYGLHGYNPNKLPKKHSVRIVLK